MSQSEAPSRATVEKPVIFRDYPKVVFLWPIAAAAALIALGSLLTPDSWGWFTYAQVAPHELAGATEAQQAALQAYNHNTGQIVNHFWGNFFFILFFLNILVLAYDFDATKGVAVFFGAAALVIGLLYLNTRWGIIDPLKELVSRVRITFSIHYMYAMALVGAMIACAIALHARFNWWELTHNELIHRKRFLGDIRRYPAQHCRMTKEIPDVMEYIFFFGCGRLVFQIPGEPRAFVLEHVPLVNRREHDIKEKLGSMSIRTESPDYSPEPGI